MTDRPHMNEDPNVPTEFDGRDVHHTHHDTVAGDALSMAVIEAVAAVAGVDPSRTRIPLERSVSPDALDELFQQTVDETDEFACLIFPVWDYTVVVHADGNIFVHEGDSPVYAGNTPGPPDDASGNEDPG